MAWRRGQTLGKGGFGMVSVAILNQESIGFDIPQVFAVKSAPVSQSSSLLEEKELLQKFQGCPGVIRCFGDETTTENGEHIYNILMEFAFGGSLASRLQKTPKGLPEHMMGLYTKSILAALSYVHKQGYVDCDIKPHNILLGEGEIAKLADFGSARKLASEKLNDQPSADAFRGTPAYAAPETISRREYEPASDIWSLGCTVLHLLSGKTPWIGEKDKEAWAVLHRIGFTDKLPEIPTKVSSQAADFLKKCLIRDLQQRWTADMLLAYPIVSNAASRKGSDEKETLLSKVRQHQKALFHALSTLLPQWLSSPKLPIHPLGA